MQTLWNKLVEKIGYDIQPSPQQQAVWDAMDASAGRIQTVRFTAFNRSIVTDFESKWGWLVRELKAIGITLAFSTMHSMGLKAVGRAFGNGRRVEVVQWRVDDILADLLHVDGRELKRRQPELLNAVRQLVSLCKMNLVDGNDGLALSDLASYYDVDLNGSSSRVFELVPQVLERCKDVNRDMRIDYDDMIWLPIILDLPVQRYDLLLVDEAQDLNKCQQALARKAGRRLVFCGDPKQSIYGFAGADAQSMVRLERELSATDRGCVHLPLTVTRRCGKAIVREAQKLVPDFEAFETNPEGKISFSAMPKKEKAEIGTGTKSSYQELVQDGDMILCRCNAPLVSECFGFLRQGRKATIQGRDVGAGLVGTIKKSLHIKGSEDEVRQQLAAKTVVELVGALDDWMHVERAKEEAKRNPSDSRLISLQDRHDCLACFCEGAATAADVVAKITAIFTDDKSGDGIRLSSVHKAKGLEAKRVFILTPKEAPMPHPMAKSAWEKDQELNIKYVAITRAIEELVWVS